MADLIGASRSVEPNAITDPGKSIYWLSPPFGATGVAQEAGSVGLTVQPAFVDAHVAAYTTTEVFDGYQKVWAQPAYQLVTAFDPVSGPVRLPGHPTVFSVCPGSGFYSPFWQIIYVLVPPGYSGQLTSSTQILDSGFQLIQGTGWLAPIAPRPDLSHAHGPTNLDDVVRPFSLDLLKQKRPDPALCEGNPVWFFNYGQGRLTFDPTTKVVQEAVLYRLAVRGADGNPLNLDVPPIIGTGSLRAPKPVSAPNGVPQFGALRHEYQVMLGTRPGDPVPGIFVPSALTALRAHLVAQVGAAMVPLPGPVAELAPERDQFTLRVAIDGTCFGQGDFPVGCTWLDTQPNVENNLPATAFVDTKRLSAGGIVLFDGGAL